MKALLDGFLCLGIFLRLPELAGRGADFEQEYSITEPFCTIDTWEAAEWDNLVIPDSAVPEAWSFSDLLTERTSADLEVLGAKDRGTSPHFLKQPPSCRVALPQLDILGVLVCPLATPGARKLVKPGVAT